MSTDLADNFEKNSIKSQFFYIGLFLFFLMAWYRYTHDIDMEIAVVGFSPVDWINQWCHPGNFIKNFPNGVEIYDKSAFMLIYKFFYTYLGVAPEKLIGFIILTEILFLSSAIYFLLRTIFPEASKILSAMIIISVVASYARDMNLGIFAAPFFKGLHYNIADGLRLISIAFFLRNKLLVSFLLLAASIITHASMGLTAGFFILAIMAVNPRQYFRISFLGGIILFTAIVSVWFGPDILREVSPDKQISAESWVALTRLNSYHFYPIEYGTFTIWHQERFLPFISFMILFVYYFTRIHPKRRIDKQILAGICLLLSLVVIGVLFSHLLLSPFLIKLALQRSNDLIIVMGLIYILRGLYDDFMNQGSWVGVLSLMILFSPFVMKPGFPLIWSLLMIHPVYLSVLKGERSFRNPENSMLLILAVLSLGLLLFYISLGIAGPWDSPAYSGLSSRHEKWFIPLLSGIAFLWLFRHFFKEKIGYAIFILIFACSFFWLTNQGMTLQNRELAQSYKEAQLWARENTSRQALFMIDPNIYYGWRDFSQRSSFGNLREWLYNWVYNSKYETYEEGIKRFNEFQIDIAPYLGFHPPIHGFYKLSQAIGEKYYAADDEWMHSLAEKYGIEYYLFLKQKMKHPPISQPSMKISIL